MSIQAISLFSQRHTHSQVPDLHFRLDIITALPALGSRAVIPDNGIRKCTTETLCKILLPHKHTILILAINILDKICLFCPRIFLMPIWPWSFFVLLPRLELMKCFKLAAHLIRGTHCVRMCISIEMFESSSTSLHEIHSHL